MEYKDYYAILGVPRTATQDEIKKAARKLARKYHPDVSQEPDAEARFKEIGEAKEVLEDPEKRAAYDQMGSNWQQGQSFEPPPNWNAGFEFRGRGDPGADFGGFGQGSHGFGEGFDHSDFFESLFGQQQGRRAHRSQRTPDMPGQDHHAKVLIDIRDAYTGAKRSIALKVPTVDDSGHVVLKERVLELTIPKGIRAGQHLRLAGQGEPGMGAGKPGDLFLEIEFNPDPLFRVEERDVYITLPLAPWELALGAAVRLPTPDGEISVNVPTGSKVGGKLRLKGKGIPAAGGNGVAGDLYALLEVVVPPAKTDAERAAYKAMAEAFDFNPRSNWHSQ